MTNKAYRDGWEQVFGSSAQKEDEENTDGEVLIEQLVKTKTFQKLPAKINKHEVFSKIKKIKKIFPFIGLKNCLEPVPYGYGIDETFKGKKTYIGFSSSGTAGLWDLATMS